MTSPSTDPLEALIEEHVLWALAKAKRFDRVVGEFDRWSCDLEEGFVVLGDARFRVDVVGTESHADETFVWAWADETFAEHQVASSLILRGLGEHAGIPALAFPGEIPLGEMSGDLAGILACEEARADAYYVAVHDEGALVFLLRSELLASATFTLTDIGFAIGELLASGQPIDYRRAVEVLAEEPPAGVSGDVSDQAIVFRTRDGVVRVGFDAMGRVAGMRMEGQSQDVVPADVESAPDDDDDDDPGEVLGSVEIEGGRLALCDPLVAIGPASAAPLIGEVPDGSHEVRAWLVDDPAGGRRIESASICWGDDEPVDWQHIGQFASESGVGCFGSPEAVLDLVENGEAAIARIEAALADSAADTWAAADVEGIVSFTTGYGAGVYDLLWGFDSAARLACVAIRCLDDVTLEGPADAPEPLRGSPGRGRQRAFLVPPAFGGTLAPDNVTDLARGAYVEQVGALRRRARERPQ